MMQRFKSWLGGPFNGAQEGSNRGPFMGLGELGGLFNLGPTEDGWQRHLSVGGTGARNVAPVYAAVSLYVRTTMQCRATHQVPNGVNGFESSTTSPASRVLRRPNEYEAWPNFVANIVAGMLFDGEALAFAVRDDRGAIQSLHRVPRGNWSIHVDPDTHTPFYGINQGDLFGKPDYLVPVRDVAHFRQLCPRHPLIGESPLAAAGLAVGLQVALNSSQLQFFSQANRPSGVLTTDQTLTRDQLRQLRESFNEQSKTLAQGGMPILAQGLKFTPMGIAQNDAQLIEQQRLSALDIFRVFGVPAALMSEGGGPQGGTEAMISHFLSTGLGSVLETLERTLERLFDLAPADRIELDPSPLLRVDFAGRIDGLTKAVQGGVLTPNEARRGEGYKALPGGDAGFMQRQNTPINLLSDLAAADLKAKNEPPPPPPAAPAQPAPEPQEPDEQVGKALVVSMLDYKRKAA